MMRRFIIVFGVSAALLISLQLLFLDGIQGEVFAALLEDDTEYASGYSATSFRAVDIGMSEQSVRGRLGDPLAIDNSYRGGVAWRYSMSPSDKNFRYRVIFFRDGLVEKVSSGFSVD